jgi:hypothetical protein
MPIDPDTILSSLGRRWTRPPSMDDNVDFRVLRGEVDAVATTEALLRVMGELGFEATTREQRGAVTVEGRKDAETLTLVAFPPTVFRGQVHRGPRLTVQWSSGRRPAVAGETHRWHGRDWPVGFAGAVVYHSSAELLIIEGATDDPAALMARTRSWGDTHGWSTGPAPGSMAAVEPDLRAPLHLSDPGFELKLDCRGSVALLTVSTRPLEP